MSSSIDVLPKEILQHVFSYLSMPDKLNISLVCKKWLSVVNCKVLLRNIIVLIDDNNKVPVLTNMSRNFLNFSFRLIIVNNKYYELFKRFSFVVEYISFEKCEVWKREPVSFDDLTYENLKILKIIDCDLWTLFPRLPNLTELYLSGSSTITDDGLAVLQQSMKRLQTLSLYCNVTFEPKAYKRFYTNGLSYEKNPSPNILSLPGVKSFISERVNTMKELHFYFSITPKALKEISGIENLHLTKISLRSCHECTGSLIDLFKNQPSLKVLDLNGVMGINNDAIDSFCSLIPDIEELYVHDCSLTDDSLGKIFQLRNLKKLDIGANHASESGFCKAVANFAPIHLKTLDVSSILVKNIYLLVQKCKYLVHLNLARCAVSDDHLHFISENLIHLQSLSLKQTDITDYGLTGMFDIGQDENVNEGNHKPLSNLKELKKLKLNNCEKITTRGIIIAIRFQYLRYLNLTGCRINRHGIYTLLLENPNIKRIYYDYTFRDPRIVTKTPDYMIDLEDEYDTFFDKCD